MEIELKAKIAGKEVKEATPGDLQMEKEKRALRSAELEFQLRAKLGDGKNENSSESSSEEEGPEDRKKRLDDEEKAAKVRRRKFDEYDYSSGVESDNDVDLLVEQEVLHGIKLKKEM